MRAIGFALAGFTFWVLADTSIKMVGSAGLPAYEVVAFLGLGIVALLVVHGAVRGQVRALWPRRPGRQLVRSCLDLTNDLCVVVALRHVPLTLFYILVFLAPMVTAVLAALFLGERLGWRRGVAIAAGFAGVVVAVNPLAAGAQGDWKGYAACMVCVACFSTNMVWSRVMTQTERPESLTFFSGLVLAVVGLGLMVVWHAEPVAGRVAVVLGAMGVFCAMGSICFFIALKHTSAANVSQYHYTQLVTGSLLSYLIWRELPTVWMVAGAVLIVGSGVYMALEAARAGVRGCGLPYLPEE